MVTKKGKMILTFLPKTLRGKNKKVCLNVDRK